MLGRWLIGATLLLGGCASSPPPQPRLAVFAEAEYAPYVGKGTSAIEGEAFMKTMAGDVKKGAGCKVSLNPVTAYSTEWYERIVLAGQTLEAPDPRAFTYRREAVADSEGRFRFEQIPAGEYYVACMIIWHYFQPYQGQVPTGGYTHAKVKVEPGQTVKAILTR